MARGATQRVVVRPVKTDEQLQQFRRVTAAYLEWLGEDLSFQQIEAELACLPGSYATEARGAMLLAYAPAAPPLTNEPGGVSSGGGGGLNSSGEAGSADCSQAEDDALECIGAVALRPLAGHTSTVPPRGSVAGTPLADVCEMKRLFVLPGHHGLGAGAALVRALLPAAAQLGYQVMVLDTLERLEGANQLYRRLGFQPCERYNDCPLPGVQYFALQLGDEAAGAAEQQQQQGQGGGGAARGGAA